MSTELHRDLGRLEGKVDSILIMFSEQMRKNEKTEERLANVESKLMWAAGIASAVMFVIGSLTSSLLKKIGII